MFNNNINKPAITVFFATDISKNYFCRGGFFRGKKRFLPVTGKNLPTLLVVIFLVHKNSVISKYTIFNLSPLKYLLLIFPFIIKPNTIKLPNIL